MKGWKTALALGAAAPAAGAVGGGYFFSVSLNQQREQNSGVQRAA